MNARLLITWSRERSGRMLVTVSCGVRYLRAFVGVTLRSLTAVQTSLLASALGRPAWIQITLATVTITALALSAPPSCAGVSGDLISTLIPANASSSWAEELRFALALL
jgi:hypothetical protein